ncbi:MAG: IclR family transcriptional regulator [Lentimonas sp.]
MNERPEQRYSAPALEKGLDILEFLASQPVPCSKSEIGEALERTPSEIYRMLCVLEQRGYVQKEEGTAAYSPSLKLFELGHQHVTTGTLRKAARLPMEQLANEIGEACHLSIQTGIDLLVMMERMPARRVCLAVGEGTTLPLSKTASGSVQLSHLDESDVCELLSEDPNFQKLSATKQAAFLKNLQKIREQSYEITNSQLSPGVIDIAMPVGIPKTDVFGTLAVSQLCDNLKSKIIKTNLNAIKNCVSRIHHNLGI